MQPFEHGGNIYRARRANPQTQLLDFSANINPLGLSATVEQAIHDNINTIIHYPDPQAYELRQAIISHYGVDNSQLTLGNGAAELIYLYAHVSGKRQALLLAPCFSEYQRACKAANLSVQFMYLQEKADFAIDYTQLIANMPEQAIVFLANPNNPTGTLLDQEQLVKLLITARERGTDIFIDESFIDFVAPNFSCAYLMRKFDNLAILHSLTKIFALPGLRLGFGLFNRHIAQLIEQAKDVWNVNTLAQAAGVVALDQHNYLSQTRAIVAELRTEFCKNLQQFSALKLYPSTVNFILLQLLNGMSAQEFCQAMLKHDILVRDCSNYPGLTSAFVRIAVRTADENKIFIQTLHKVL